MRKNVKNDKVLRAMVIGISAMMMASSPMAVLAAEGEGTQPSEDPEPIVNAEETGVCDAAESAADDAKNAVDTAKDSAKDVKDDIVDNEQVGEAGSSETTEEPESTEEPKTAEETESTTDLAQEVIDAANDVENVAAEGGAPLEKAGTAIGTADTDLGKAEANDELADAELTKAEKATAEANTIAAEVKEEMQAASDTVDEQSKNIDSATTVEDTNAALDEVRNTVEDAQKDFDEKLDAYNSAKANYELAKADLAKYEEAYNNAIDSAEGNAEVAAVELAKAQKNAEALKNAVDAAKDAVDNSSAMAIAEIEASTRADFGKNSNLQNWQNQDKLFESIMQNYYLPEVLGITGETTVTRKGFSDDQYNYFEVKYTDENGNPQVKYFNYKRDNAANSDIVIFEKRAEEVNYKDAQNSNPDEYKGTDKTYSVGEVDEGLEDESIIDVDPTEDGKKLVVKGGLTDSEESVKNSEITGTSSNDVTINNEQASWALDENGNLVKTVTADVTTITYNGATFISDKDYATDTERDAAAEAMKAKLPIAANKDVTVDETEKTTYTATGTYIPTFTRTVEIKDSEVERKHSNKWSDWGVWTEDEAISQVQKKGEKGLERDIRSDDDLYFIGVSSDLKVSGHTTPTTEDIKIFGKVVDTVVTDDSDYLVSGSVTATYAKVTKKTVSQSTLGSLWNDFLALFGIGSTTNDQIKADVLRAIGVDGGIFVSANWIDGNWDEATVRYVEGVKVETGAMESEKEAEDALDGLIKESMQNKNATGVYNPNKSIDSETKYSYKINYLTKVSETTENNQEIATETYGNADVLSGVIIQNKNYKKGNLLLTQKDKEYRTFVDDAKALTEKYAGLLEKAQEAQNKVEIAQGKVDTLKKEIENLNPNKGETSRLDSLEKLKADLKAAEADKDAAQEILDEILKKLEDAEQAARDRIQQILDEEAQNAGGTTGGTAGGTTGGAGEGAAGGTATVVATAAGDATVVAAEGVAQTVADQAVLGANRSNSSATKVADAEESNETAISAEETKEVADAKKVVLDEEKETPVEIADEETALAPTIPAEEKAKMSWWWLLIIAICGATGYTWYRNHQQKKVEGEDTEA